MPSGVARIPSSERPLLLKLMAVCLKCCALGRWMQIRDSLVRQWAIALEMIARAVVLAPPSCRSTIPVDMGVR